MKNKSGFTLVELMGVIAVLAIISLIAIPVVEKNVKKGKEEARKVQIQNIQLAAQNWVSDNKTTMVNYFITCEKEDETLPCNTKIMTLQELITEGYMDNETLIDPVTSNQINLDTSYVEITYITKKNYKYEVVLKNVY